MGPPIVMALALLAAALAGVAPLGGPRLEAGVFLFAAPSLKGSIFEASVIVLVAHDGDGSMGLIVNKPTDISLESALDMGAAGRLTRPLYLGGPVAPGAMLALLRSASSLPEARRVLPEVSLIGDRSLLERALGEDDADQTVRVYAGYAGWSAGQLEGEIAEGAWVVTRGDADMIFLDDPTKLWLEVYRLLDRIQAFDPEGIQRTPREPLRERSPPALRGELVSCNRGIESADRAARSGRLVDECRYQPRERVCAADLAGGRGAAARAALPKQRARATSTSWRCGPLRRCPCRRAA